MSDTLFRLYLSPTGTLHLARMAILVGGGRCTAADVECGRRVAMDWYASGYWKYRLRRQHNVQPTCKSCIKIARKGGRDT